MISRDSNKDRGFYQKIFYHNIPFVAAPLYLIFSTFSLLPSQHGKIFLSSLFSFSSLNALVPHTPFKGYADNVMGM
jgi:hypothetical protein